VLGSLKRANEKKKEQKPVVPVDYNAMRIRENLEVRESRQSIDDFGLDKLQTAEF